jgi:hypothetical protein
VQVDALGSRQLSRKLGREPGAEQPPGPPAHPLRSLVSSPAVDAHVWLAAGA